MGRGFDDRSTYQIVCLTALGIVGPVVAGEFLKTVLGNPSAHPVERAGVAMIATGLTLSVPVLLAATTSGRWYAAKACQPELIYRIIEDGGVDLEWESRPIHVFLPMSVVVLIVAGLGLANLPAFARDKEMTVEGVILFLIDAASRQGVLRSVWYLEGESEEGNAHLRDSRAQENCV